MLSIASAFRDALVPFLIAGTTALVAMLAALVIQRFVRQARTVWRDRAAFRYQPDMDRALAGDDQAIERLQRAPRRHRGVIAELLLRPLAFVKGDISERARAVADHTGLLHRWRGDLDQPGWWVRAEAALALGLVHDRDSIALLTRALDDSHQQVRAAAVDSLGRIGDASVAPLLLARLPEQARNERTRIVEALRRIGGEAITPLLEHTRHHPADRALAAEVLALLGGSDAVTALLDWTTDDRAAVRAAAWRALATIGIDNRAFYHALRALADDDADVRAAAALAVGRSGRPESASYLAARLDDEWVVAAQAARALSRVGASGLAALQQRADGAEGLGRDLARQLAWEAARR